MNRRGRTDVADSKDFNLDEIALQTKIGAAKKLPDPSFRMILTAVGDSAYTRKEDGIVVCPLSCLRP